MIKLAQDAIKASDWIDKKAKVYVQVGRHSTSFEVTLTPMTLLNIFKEYGGEGIFISFEISS